MFSEKVIERLGLDTGCPPKIKIDDADSGTFSTAGDWTTASARVEEFGSSYRFSYGGTGACTAGGFGGAFTATCGRTAAATGGGAAAALPANAAPVTV